MLTLEETAEALDISTSTVKLWRDRGLITYHVFDDKNECLYELDPNNRPEKFRHKKRKVMSNLVDEV